jgi:hypothetical protein
MKLSPISAAVFMQHGRTVQSPRMAVLPYFLAGGPMTNIKR